MINLEFLEFLEYLGGYTSNIPIWGISLVLSYLLVLIFSLEKAVRKGIPREDIFNVVSISFIFGLISARIMYLYIMQENLDFLNIFNWKAIFYQGELSVVGGYLGGLLSGWMYLQGFNAMYRFKISWLRFFDTFLPIIVIGMIFGYLGIFSITFNKGALSTAEYPWLIMSGDNYVHPWALYVTIGYLILFIIISRLYNKLYSTTISGYITTYFVIGVSLIHFITDFWRTTNLQYSGSRINGLTISQLIFLFIIFITILVSLFIKTKSSHTKQIL
ncbi:MAG: prolipoprotein diacylglyceryl transferase family protein [Minisyncoccia bacterium]